MAALDNQLTPGSPSEAAIRAVTTPEIAFAWLLGIGIPALLLAYAVSALITDPALQAIALIFFLLI